MNRKEKRATKNWNYHKVRYYHSHHAWRFDARNFPQRRRDLERLAGIQFPRWMKLTPDLAGMLIAALKRDTFWWEAGLRRVTWRD